MSTTIKTLFLDMGGVILTNGWGRKSRELAADKFSLDFIDMNERHRMAFDSYETGKMSLRDYLALTVFFVERPFTPEVFMEFMYQQSQPLQEMLDFVKKLKQLNKLQVVSLNNEGKELNDYRIRTFHLDKLFDAFVSSAFVHLRKPDKDIYKLALDVAYVKPEESLYLDDRLMFVNVARSLGINSIQHVSVEQTKLELGQFGLLTP
jgi:putative hydrolase of the HAD superfamily